MANVSVKLDCRPFSASPVSTVQVFAWFALDPSGRVDWFIDCMVLSLCQPHFARLYICRWPCGKQCFWKRGSTQMAKRFIRPVCSSCRGKRAVSRVAGLVPNLHYQRGFFSNSLRMIFDARFWKKRGRPDRWRGERDGLTSDALKLISNLAEMFNSRPTLNRVWWAKGDEFRHD